MGEELYVYYKVRAADAAAAQAAFVAARAAAGLRLLQRVDAAEPELLTWMEIYPSALAADAALQARMEQAMAPWREGARHLERFAALL